MSDNKWIDLRSDTFMEMTQPSISWKRKQQR